MSTFPHDLGNPPSAAPCPHSGLVGCTSPHDDPRDVLGAAFCDVPLQHIAPSIPGGDGLLVSASRVVHPSGYVREIVVVSRIGADGTEHEPVELDQDGARALVLAVLNACDLAAVTR